MMGGMYDHNEDGRLSAGAESGHMGMRLLGLLALMAGVSTFIFIPGLALIMLALAVILFIC